MSSASTSENATPNTTAIVSVTENQCVHNTAIESTIDENVSNDLKSDEVLVYASNSPGDVVDVLELIGDITKHKNKEKQDNALKHVDHFLIRGYHKMVHDPYKEVKKSKEILYQMLVDEDKFLIILQLIFLKKLDATKMIHCPC